MSSIRIPMSRQHLGLGLLLGVQLVLALLARFSIHSLTPAPAQGPLLRFEPDRIARLILASKEDELVLETGDGRWVLPALGDFPADARKVGALLEKLAGLERRIPVATSESAQTRFQVAEDRFVRRLTLEERGGDTRGILYLGDSAGYRRLFARVEGDPEIYGVAIAASDVSVQPDDWTDKTALQVDEDRILGIETDTLHLERTEAGDWRLAGSDGALDQETVEELVRSIAHLRFQGILGRTPEPKYGQDQPIQRLRVRIGDETWEYRFSRLADGDDLVLKRSDRPEYFRLLPYGLENLLELKPADLLPGEDRDDTSEGEDTDSQAD